MSLLLKLTTWALFAIPVVLGWAANAAPVPVRWLLLATTAFMLLSFMMVWFAWRPTRFEITRHTLNIVWPVRTRRIQKADLEDVKLMDASEFRKEFGYGMRIGAGGLWGGFGLLKTGRETFSMWISRTDRFVMVRLRGARTLLITPEEPERFVAELLSSVAASPATVRE